MTAALLYDTTTTATSGTTSGECMGGNGRMT